MPIPTPSAAQLEVYGRRPSQRPVVLFYRFDHRTDAEGARTLDQLSKLASAHRGRLRWRGVEEQVLIGAMTLVGYCALLHFRTRAEALELVRSPAHEALFAHARHLQIVVIGEQPRASRAIVRLMTIALPYWPFFDNRIDPGPEPGIGTSVMPTQADYDRFLAHPEPRRPLVMVNWLRFRAQAHYADGEAADRVPVSGQAAYYRYGKIAFLAIHSLRGSAVFMGRYQQMLVGNNGDPGNDLWHEFVMVEYPGRAAFKRMIDLKRYRAGLAHRAAGLTEGGQGLVVTHEIPGQSPG